MKEGKLVAQVLCSYYNRLFKSQPPFIFNTFFKVILITPPLLFQEVILELLEENIKKQTKMVLLDGFPRELKQAKTFEEKVRTTILPQG